METTGTIEYRLPPIMKLEEGDQLTQWCKFKYMFKNFITAAGFENKSETRKAAILLNSVGPQLQEIYFNILKKKESPKLEELLDIFNEYFEPKKNEVISSYKFNTRIQEDGESFDEYFADLKKLAKLCSYKDIEERMIRDRIVIGIQDKKVQEKLLGMKDLTMDQAVDICRSAQLVREQQLIIASQSMPVDAVRRRSPKPSPTTTHIKDEYSNNNNFNNKKYNINSNNNMSSYNNFLKYLCKKCHIVHEPRNCPAYGKKCMNCNKFNHFKIGCKEKLNL